MGFYEFLYGDRFVDNRDGGLEGLFGGADEDFLYALCFQDASFRMFSYYRREFVKADFAGLFGEPFITVVILGGAYGHVKHVWMPAPVVLGGYDHGFDTLVTVGSDTASVQGSAAVYYGDFIAGAMAEDFDAVSGFVLVEAADSAFYVAGVEKFHGEKDFRIQI